MLGAACAAVALAFAVAVPSARGMAMYDNSTYYEGGATVDFVCGLFCGWVEHFMPFHQQIAYPGKGGSFELTQDDCIMGSGHPKIEDHGYAEVSGAELNSSSDDVKWSMWGNTENVISGSPWNVICTPKPAERALSYAARAAGPGWVERQFRIWDTDGDGTLSAAELRAGVGRDFRQIDLNHDGVIDRRDVRLDLAGQSGARRRKGTLLPFDLNHDGTARPGEYWRYVRRTFVAPTGSGPGGVVTLRQAKAFYATLP